MWNYVKIDKEMMQENTNKSYLLVMVIEMGKKTSYFLLLLCSPKNNLISTIKSNVTP